MGKNKAEISGRKPPRLNPNQTPDLDYTSGGSVTTKSKPYLFSLFLGNFLSHYDIALFWVLSPFLAPILFPNLNLIEGYALFYLLIPFSKWARPLGAWFLGKLSVRIGPHKTLILSLTGLAISCLGMGLCPTGNPLVSFMWVAVCRMVMYFFSASETSAASWLILEQSNKKGLMSGLVGSTNLLGYIFGALLVALLSSMGSVETSWRWLYLSGTLLGVGALLLRIVFKKSESFSEYVSIFKQNYDPLVQTKKEKVLNKQVIAKIALATCFSYGTYEVCMSIAYTSLPAITLIEKNHLLWLNLGLLGFDALLLPWFGQIAEKVGKEKIMAAAAFLWAAFSGYFLDLLHGASFMEVTLVRGILVLVGVAFAAPFYSWASSLVPAKSEVLHLSLGSSIGKYIGGFIPALLFFLYHEFNSFLIASIPLACISFATAFILIKKSVFERDDSLQTKPDQIPIIEDLE